MKVKLTDWSKKEIELFSALGHADLLDKVAPVDLYRMAALDCFINGDTGKAVDSLRNCLGAIHKAGRNMDVYRLTPEFDALIELVPVQSEPKPILPNRSEQKIAEKFKDFTVPKETNDSTHDYFGGHTAGEPHPCMAATGSEGRCELCGQGYESYLHQAYTAGERGRRECGKE